MSDVCKQYGGKKSPCPLQHAAAAARRLDVLQAVRNKGSALRDAGPLRADRDVVLAAVRKNGRAIEFAAPHLRGDPHVAREAVRQTGEALGHLPDALKDDMDMVRLAMKTWPWAAQWASRRLRDDIAFASECLQAEPRLIEHFTGALHNEELAIAVLRMRSHHTPYRNTLEQLPLPVRERRVVLTAVENGEDRALRLAPRFQDDREVVIAALTHAPWSREPRRGVKGCALPDCIHTVSDRLLADRGVALAALCSARSGARANVASADRILAVFGPSVVALRDEIFMDVESALLGGRLVKAEQMLAVAWCLLCPANMTPANTFFAAGIDCSSLIVSAVRSSHCRQLPTVSVVARANTQRTRGRVTDVDDGRAASGGVSAQHRAAMTADAAPTAVQQLFAAFSNAQDVLGAAEYRAYLMAVDLWGEAPYTDRNWPAAFDREIAVLQTRRIMSERRPQPRATAVDLLAFQRLYSEFREPGDAAADLRLVHARAAPTR